MDLSGLDDFVASVEKKPAQPSKVPAPIRNNNPGALMPGGKLASYGSLDEGLKALDDNLISYGKKGINTLEGVIKRWAPPNENDTAAYIAHAARVTGLDPKQQIDLSNPLTRLNIKAAITQKESGTKALYQVSTKAPVTASQPVAQAGGMDLSGLDDFVRSAENFEQGKPEQTSTATKAGLIDTATKFAAPAVGKMAGGLVGVGNQLTGKQLVPPEAVQQGIAKLGQAPAGNLTDTTETEAYKNAPQTALDYAKNVGKGLASAVDTAYGVVPAVVGGATYAGARAFGQTPEEAEKTQQSVAAKMENPIGNLLGITEDPAYKGEASRQLMEYINQNMDKGADWISEKTGIPKADVANMMGTLSLAAPELMKTAKGKPGAAVKAGEAEARQAWTRPEPGTEVAAPIAENGWGQSVGSAARSRADLIREGIAQASPELQAALQDIPINEMNSKALERHLEADSIGVQLTRGEATGDPIILSKERNSRGEMPELAQHYQEKNQQLVNAIFKAKEEAMPEFSVSQIQAAEEIINIYKKYEEKRNQNITDAYQVLKDLNGGQFPLDVAALKQNIEAVLQAENLTYFVPPAVRSTLDNILGKNTITFNSFESLRTILENERRVAKGSEKAAIGFIRGEVEKLPMTIETAASKEAADYARSLAKEHFDDLKRDKVYRDIVDDKVNPATFFDNYITSRTANYAKLRQFMDRVPESDLQNYLMSGTIDWLIGQAKASETKGTPFANSSYHKAIGHLNSTRKAETIFTPELHQKLNTIDNVSGYIFDQPEGNFINNSRSTVAFIARRAEQAVNAAAKRSAIVSAAKEIYSSSQKEQFLKDTLEPGAGVRTPHYQR